MRTYLAKYHDAHGEIATILETDGEMIWMSLGGVVFSGRDLDALAPVHPLDAPQAARFRLNNGDLCACTLNFEIPIALLFEHREVQGALEAHLVLGAPAAGGRINQEDLRLVLTFEQTRLESSGRSGWFEDELLDLQRQLGGGTFKSCFGCGLSDYSPYGHGLFGWLACFRSNKEEYRKVESKIALFAIWDTHERLVQETHLCPDFERRRPNAGYRG